MKKINKGQFRFILFLSLFLTLSFSCQRVMDDGEEDDVSSSDGTALKIMARSGGNTSIEYPVYLYAFNEKGDCAAKQKITSEEVEMNLQLPSGNFKVVALSGVSKGYVMSDNPKISDVITMQEGGCASKAMMMGMADVSLEGKNKTVNLMLTYMVASLNVVLTKADKVKQVKVGKETGNRVCVRDRWEMDCGTCLYLSRFRLSNHFVHHAGRFKRKPHVWICQ